MLGGLAGASVFLNPGGQAMYFTACRHCMRDLVPSTKYHPVRRVFLAFNSSQRVHEGIWYILRAQKGSHIFTLRPKYTPYSYMDPLGLNLKRTLAASMRTHPALHGGLGFRVPRKVLPSFALRVQARIQIIGF